MLAAGPTGSGAYDTPSPAAGGTTPAAAGAGAKSNGTKLTVWGWQSFTPDGDKALGDQMKEWGSANNTEVEYVVVENSQFPQKLAAAVEAKAPPDVVMLTAASNVIDYASRTLLVDVSDVWKATSSQAGGFWSYVEPLYRIGSTYFGIPFEAETSPMFARTDLIKQASGSTDPPKTLDDLTSVAQKINSPPDVYALGFTLGRTPDAFGNAMAIIWNDGGALVDKDGKVALNSPGNRHRCDPYQELVGRQDRSAGFADLGRHGQQRGIPEEPIRIRHQSAVGLRLDGG